jgi:hypothetical protein
MTNSTPAGEEFIYLLGRTPLEEFLDFMSREPLDAATFDRDRLTAVWAAAQTAVEELACREADWADYPELTPVPAALKPLVAQVRADPFFERAFAQAPNAIGMVELDRLVVRQKTINLAQVQRLQQQLGASLSSEELFRFCLPFGRPVVPPRVTILPDGTYDFASPSNDLRFLEAVALRPDQVGDYQPFGPVAAVIGLVVGYGTNYLNAIAAEGRLVLHNGSHRAYALRDLGVTHVPCVIQEARDRDELMRIATGALRRLPDLYLQDPRPPLLKDYFNPRLRHLVRLAPLLRHVQIRFTREEFDQPGTWQD